MGAFLLQLSSLQRRVLPLLGQEGMENPGETIEPKPNPLRCLGLQEVHVPVCPTHQ